MAFAAVGGCARPAPPDGTIVVGLESMPTDLDPRFATDAASSRIDDLVFRSLTRVDSHQRHVPDLARDWRWEGPRTVRFRLDPGATFSDGTPLTAADVRATYESILDPASGSPKRGELAFLAAVEAPEEHAVVFRLREPFAPLLTATTIGILPRERLASRRRVWVGAGPYRIAAVRPGRDVRLSARPGSARIGEIRFRVIPDDTVRTLELAEGNLDLVENAIEPDDLGWLERHSATCVERVPGSTFQYLGLNFREPALRDLRVRRAIAQAIDRPALIAHLLDGTARAASGLLAPEHWAYEGDVARHPYDPAAARRLLDEAGYPDPDGPGPRVRLRLSYKTSTLDSRRRLGEAVQAMLAAVGIGLEVRGYEWGTFYADVRRGNFELYSLAWVGITDPDFFFTLLHSTMTPPRGDNRGGYADPEIDRLTSLGRKSSDVAERRRIYAEVQRRAARDLPFIPLWWTDNVVVRSRRLCGFVPRPDGSLESLATAWIDPGKDEGAPGPCPCGGGS